MAFITRVLLTACLLAAASIATAQRLATGASQICQTLNNPYGVVEILADAGTLKKGNFLVSAWNDAAKNNPGAGNIIYQCTPSGQASAWANIALPANGACIKDGAGIGVTMALVYCNGVVIVGSTPIKDPNAGIASSGCLLALDNTGKVLADVKAPAINGPWGATCTTNGNQLTLFVSSVLGGLSSSSTPSTGRKLQQGSSSNSVSGGIIARWTFNTPTSGQFNLGTATVIVQGIKTNATGIAGGSVAPGNPALGDDGTLYFPSFFDNSIGYVKNAVSAGANAGFKTLQGVTGLNGPNSLFYMNDMLLGANTMDGNLFIVSLNNNGNGGTTKLVLVDSSTNAAGFLFNAIFTHDKTLIVFPNDGLNTLNKIANPMASTSTTTTGLCTSGFKLPSGVPAPPCSQAGNFYLLLGAVTSNNCATPSGKTCQAVNLTNTGTQLGAAYAQIQPGSACQCQ